jgi:hypothetical protein
MHDLVSKLIRDVFFSYLKHVIQEEKKTCYFQNNALKEIKLSKFMHTNKVGKARDSFIKKPLKKG